MKSQFENDTGFDLAGLNDEGRLMAARFFADLVFRGVTDAAQIAALVNTLPYIAEQTIGAAGSRKEAIKAGKAFAAQIAEHFEQFNLAMTRVNAQMHQRLATLLQTHADTSTTKQ